MTQKNLACGRFLDMIKLTSDWEKLFKQNFVDDQSLKQDFEDFVSLVETAISKHPVPKQATEAAGVNIQQCELDQLKSLLKEFTPFNDSHASIMYGATILWGSSQKKHFFSRLNDVLQRTGCARCLFLPPTSFWWEDILPTNSLQETLDYLVEETGIRNPWYYVPAGIVVLIRNYCVHSTPVVDPFNEIEMTFPGIAGKIYNSLVRGSYWNETLTWQFLPANHQEKQLFMKDHLGNIKQLSFPMIKTVREYIMEERSIWRKD